jgi:hypothetical protein
VPVNDHQTNLIGAAGLVGFRGMKTERRRAMSIQTLEGAAPQSNQWAAELEAGRGCDAHWPRRRAAIKRRIFHNGDAGIRATKQPRRG